MTIIDNNPFTLDDVTPEFVEPKTGSDDDGILPEVAELLGREKPAETPSAARPSGKGPTMFERLTKSGSARKDSNGNSSPPDSKGGSGTVRPRATPARTIPRKKGQYIKSLTEMYTMASLAVMMINQEVSKSIALNAEQCAIAMDELAYENDSVNRVLHSLVETTVVGKVFMAHLPILLVIATQTPAMKNSPTLINLAAMMNVDETA